MKERRKIVQNTVEKLLKTKMQQTQLVNKVSKATILARLSCWMIFLTGTDAGPV
jgi:hypothetical protein